jgi:pimeloyl-ACP methyl ester carboxylesterase
VRLLPATLLSGAALLAGCGGGDEREASPPPAPTPSTATQEAADELDGCATSQDGEIVQLSVEGEMLDGIVVGDGRAGAVLAHQRGSNLCEWLPYAKRLAGRGYSALAFDFSNSVSLPDSVTAAAEELRRRGAQRIVLAGASMGGTASLVAARSVRGVVGVVSLSGPELYSDLDAGAAVRSLEVPVLLFAARGDGHFPADARRLYRQAQSDDKELVLLPGAAHGTALLSAGRARGLFESFVAEQTG